jgi:imipenem/basic amino acid-specific outer membrane pore
MKLGKLSLVAVMALGTSAFAIENVKVSGEAKLIYQTADWETAATDNVNAKTGMFEQGTVGTPLVGASYGGGASGGAALTVGMTADLTKNVSAGAEVQAFSTLGLENNLVSNVMQGGNLDIEDAAAMSQVWLAGTVGKTTLKAGRQELDTPLAFTEKWNLIKNTFDAIVVLNNDLPDTTLVGAWVGKHNGTPDGLGYTAHLNPYTTFGSGVAGHGGAYAAGVVNKSIPGATVQGWYYNVTAVANAYWLQADAKVMDMITLGGQYANLDPKAAGTKDSKIWAVKAGVDVAGVNLYAAYSEADKDGAHNFANVSTGDKTKIYTGDGSIYMDGIVTRAGAETIKLGASTKMVPGLTLAASYASASDVGAANRDIAAWDVSASGAVGPLGLTAIYTQVDNETDAAGVIGAAGSIYAGRDTDTLRIIASLKF